MKRTAALILCAIIIAGVFTGCSRKQESADGDKLNIVCTIFPEYDWVRRIVGDAGGVELTMLLKNGVDLHSYQPTTDDIIKISSCDVFIYSGGASGAWVDEVLRDAKNKSMTVISLLDELGDGAKLEELSEGMEEEPEEEEPEYDEHVWLSVKYAARLCGIISEKLAAVSPENADTFSKNAAEYKSELDALDGEFAEAVKNAKFDTLVFGDRFPFRYLVDDYGISYFAAFPGCSAETEASFETIAFLAAKVDELGLTSVVSIEGSDHRIAKTIIENTAGKNQSNPVLDSMQAVTSGDIEGGATYISIMRNNLEALKQALN